MVYILLFYFFSFLFAVATALLGLSFTRADRNKYKFLKLLDGKRVILLVISVFSAIGTTIFGIIKEMPLEDTVVDSEIKVDITDEIKSKDKNALLASSFFQIGEEYLTNSNPVEAKKFFQKSINSFPTASAYHRLGISFYNLAKYDSALISLDKGLSIIRSKKNPNLLCSILINTGDVYLKISSLDKALEYYFESIPLINSKNFTLRSKVLGNIALVYIEQRRYLEAENELLEALELDKKNNFDQGSILINTLLAYIYNDQKQYPKAIIFGQEGLEQARVEQNTNAEMQLLFILIEAHRNNSNLENAELLCYDLLKIIKTNYDGFYFPRVIGQLGIINHQLGKREKAIYFYSIALDWYKKTNDSISAITAEGELKLEKGLDFVDKGQYKLSKEMLSSVLADPRIQEEWVLYNAMIFYAKSVICLYPPSNDRNTASVVIWDLEHFGRQNYYFGQYLKSQKELIEYFEKEPSNFRKYQTIVYR